MALKGPVGLKQLRHPKEDYAMIGLRWYSDASFEPYIIETGKPLDVADVEISGSAGDVVLLNAKLVVQNVEWVEVPAGDDAPVAAFADEGADND